MSFRSLSLSGFPVDKESLNFAEEIAKLSGVKEVLLLPDAYTKDKYVGLDYKITVPSSSAIVSEADVLYPQLRSRGINCGMMAVALPFEAAEITKEFIDELMTTLTYDPLYYVAYRLRVPLFTGRHDLSNDEFIKILLGDEFVLSDIQPLLNQDWLFKRTVRMRHSFGRYFGGNHYFELQKAEQDVAELGIKAGQVVAMFHTGCQGIQSVVRPDLAQKYFYSTSYVPTHEGEEMYKAFFIAQSMLKRYVDAYRHATYSILAEVVAKHYEGDTKIVLNKGHNEVSREMVSGAESLVYRHNAEEIRRGSFAIVSGMYDHASYIVRGEEGASDFCNTIDHGLGKILERDNTPKNYSEKTVQLFRYSKGLRILKNKPTTIQVYESEAAKDYFKLMAEKKLAHKVLTLTPFVNMKYLK